MATQRVSDRAFELPEAELLRALRACAVGSGWRAITLVVDHEDAPAVLTWPATALRELGAAASPGREALGRGSPVSRTLSQPVEGAGIVGCVAVPVADSVLPASVTGWLARPPVAEDRAQAACAAAMLEGPLRRALAPRRPWDAVARLGPQLDRIPAGIACIDEDGRIRTWSAHLAMLLDHGADVALGRTLDELGLAPGGTLLASSRTLARKVRDLGGEVSIEVLHPTSRGVVPCVWSLSATAADVGVTAVVRRRDEEPTLHTVDGPGSCGALAHELNNVVASILLNAELLDATLSPAADGAAYMNQLLASTERAARLGALLLMASGCTGFGRDAVDLRGVVDDELAQLSRRLPAATCLQRDLPAEPVVVRCDARQLPTVVRGLLANALDALPGGAGRIELTLDVVDLAPGQAGAQGLSRPGRYARLAVQDSGVGMDEGLRQRAVEPFFSTRRTRLGLGLPAARGLAEGYGGRLDLESAPGRGTRAVVWLPVLGGGADPTAAS